MKVLPLTQPFNPLRRDMRDTLLWTFYLPALAGWPFVSAFPVFSLVGNRGSATATVIELLFLFTGFWTLLFGASLYWLLKINSASRRQSQPRKSRGLLLGLYATVWTLSYIAVSLMI
jgi:hypothetical protein